jgi:hypothetical protein
LIKSADRILLIREIILQFEHFMIHCTVRVHETASKLRHMEDNMYLRQVRWHFQLIGHFSTSLRECGRDQCSEELTCPWFRSGECPS